MQYNWDFRTTGKWAITPADMLIYKLCADLLYQHVIVDFIYKVSFIIKSYLTSFFGCDVEKPRNALCTPQSLHIWLTLALARYIVTLFARNCSKFIAVAELTTLFREVKIGRNTFIAMLAINPRLALALSGFFIAGCSN